MEARSPLASDGLLVRNQVPRRGIRSRPNTRNAKRNTVSTRGGPAPRGVPTRGTSPNGRGAPTNMRARGTRRGVPIRGNATRSRGQLGGLANRGKNPSVPIIRRPPPTPIKSELSCENLHSHNENTKEQENIELKNEEEAGASPPLERSKAMESALRREAIGQETIEDRREKTKKVHKTFTYAELTEQGEEKTSNTMKKRNHVFKELVATEKSFVRSLRCVVEHYITPLREDVDNLRIVTADEITSLFSNLEVILPVNEELLAQLEKREELWPESNDCCGDIFLTTTPYLKLYSEYEKGTNKSRSLMQRLRNNDKFLDFEYERLPLTNNLDLDALLIMPIQRIPRYRLLLEDLIQNTWTDHKDYHDLDKALQAIKSVAKALNDDIRAHESNAKVQAISELLKGSPDLVAPHRFFVRQETLKISIKAKKPLKEAQLYFFNDMIVVSYSKKFKCMVDYFDSWVRVFPFNPKPNTTIISRHTLPLLEIWSPLRTLRICFASEDEQMNFAVLYCNLIQQAIEIRPMLEDRRIALYEQLQTKIRGAPPDMPYLRAISKDSKFHNGAIEFDVTGAASILTTRQMNKNRVTSLSFSDGIIPAAYQRSSLSSSASTGDLLDSTTPKETKPSDKLVLSSASTSNSNSIVSFKKGVLKEGSLTKQGGTVKSWKRRWFVLQQGLLYYYKDNMAIKPLGDIVLHSTMVEKVETEKIGKSFCFRIVTRGTLQRDGRDYYIYADTEKECDEWISKLQEIIQSTESWIKCGWLLKKEKQWKKWRLRWWTMDKNNMYYFKNDEDDVPSGTIPLQGTQLKSYDGEQEHSFVLNRKQKTYFIAGQTKEEADEWIDVIQQFLGGKQRRNSATG